MTPPPRLQVPYATLRTLPVDHDDLYHMIEREDVVLTHVVPAHLLRCFRAAAGKVDGATARRVVQRWMASGKVHAHPQLGAAAARLRSWVMGA